MKPKPSIERIHINAAVTWGTMTAELKVTGFSLSVTHTLNNLLGLTCHAAPEQSQDVWDDNQLLSHSPGAECRCSPGCSRPVLPQLCPSAAEPAAVSSCRRGSVSSETSETSTRKSFQKCTCTTENQLCNFNKLGQQASKLLVNELLSCKPLQSHNCKVFHSPPLQPTSLESRQIPQTAAFNLLLH